jgi:hypothetical protein
MAAKVTPPETYLQRIIKMNFVAHIWMIYIKSNFPIPQTCLAFVHIDDMPDRQVCILHDREWLIIRQPTKIGEAEAIMVIQ